MLAAFEQLLLIDNSLLLAACTLTAFEQLLLLLAALTCLCQTNTASLSTFWQGALQSEQASACCSRSALCVRVRVASVSSRSLVFSFIFLYTSLFR